MRGVGNGDCAAPQQGGLGWYGGDGERYRVGDLRGNGRGDGVV